MKTLIIFGAGQMGLAAAELVNRNRVQLMAWADNNEKKWTMPDGSMPPNQCDSHPQSRTSGSSLDGIQQLGDNSIKTVEESDNKTITDKNQSIKENQSQRTQNSENIPTVSAHAALAARPDEILISLLGQDRCTQLAGQLKELGYQGKIRFLRELYEDFDIRSRTIRLLAERVQQVPGAIAELGVYRGDTAWQLNQLFPERKLYLFDTFTGFDERDIAIENARAENNNTETQARTQADTKAITKAGTETESKKTPEISERNISDTNKTVDTIRNRSSLSCYVTVDTKAAKSGLMNLKARQGDFSDTSLDAVLARMPHPDMCLPRKGFFPETAAGLEDEHFGLVSLDPDLYAPTLAGLRFFWPRLNRGGVIVVHDYNNKQFEGVRRAVREYEAEIGCRLPLIPLADLHGSCVIIK